MYMCWRWTVDILAVFSILVFTFTRYARGARALGCSGERIQLKCLGSRVIVPQSATYGRSVRHICPSDHDVTFRTCTETSLSVVNALCFGVNSCDIYVNATTFKNDPCPNTSKYLEMEYECIDRKLIFNICKHRFIVEDQGYLVSPNYPFENSDKKDCSVRLKVKHTKYTFIEILDVNLPSSTDACEDYVAIKSEFKSWQRYYFCQEIVRSSPRIMISLQGALVEYKTHGRLKHHGFLLRYDISGNHTLDNRHAEKLQNRMRPRDGFPAASKSPSQNNKPGLPPPNELAKFLNLSGDPIERDHKIEKLAEKFQVGKAQIMEHVNEFMNSQHGPAPNARQLDNYPATDRLEATGPQDHVVDLRRFPHKSTTAVQLPWNNIAPDEEGVDQGGKLDPGIINDDINADLGDNENRLLARKIPDIQSDEVEKDAAEIPNGDNQENVHDARAIPQRETIQPEDPPDDCSEIAAKKLVPMYGTLEKYTPMKLVRVGCIPSMKLMDEDEAVFLCHENRWIGGLPKCVPALCRSLNNIPHGRVVMQDRKEGGQAEYSCLSGYRLKGEATRTCLTNVRWSGTEPQCVPVKTKKHEQTSGSWWSQMMPLHVPLAVAFTLAFYLLRRRLSRLPSMILNGRKSF